jgi:type I restriction enzyme, R subunit
VRLNPTLPTEALTDAFRKLIRPEGPTLEACNRAIHRLLVDGVTVEYRTADGAIHGAQARVLDFDNPDNNNWLAANQFTVSEHKHTRRPDMVLFINGLPLALIELKNAADEDATIWSAYQQLQTYQAGLPTLFAFNVLLVVSDGVEARIGTLTAGREGFKPWRTISGETLADRHLPEPQVMLEGVFDKRRLLDLVWHFIVFEDAGGGPLGKKMAGYHQFHAVNVAVTETLRAAQLQQEADRVAEARGGYEAGQRPGGQPGDRRIGVVWHTQGAGKSLTMAFYDALEVNDSAVQVLGEPTLKTMAGELTESVRRNVTVDWTVRENVRAQVHVRVKRILRKYGYPPDKQEQATQTVIEQAEVLSHAWAAA